ncbi:MAG: flippase-like domain-containing protein [Nitrospirae bacterium]|nr:flippase-like domain-containing protein [Nitrospirota bacterium]
MALKANRLLLFILKFSVSLVLIYIVLSKTGPELVYSTMKNMNPLAFISALILYLFAQFISTLRWRLLISENIGIRKLFSIYLIGSFFNNLLPGLIGGDAVKGFYLYKTIGKGNLSFASIFMDRYIGFSTLILICMAAYPFGYSYLKGSSLIWTFPIIVLMFVTASLFFFGLHVGRRIMFLSEIYSYFYSYREKKLLILKTLLLSLIIQISGILSVYILAIGLSKNIPFLACLMFLPLIIMFTAIPISISGVGVREGAFILFFGLIGIKSDVAIAISLSWFLTGVTVNLLGLAEYLRYRRKK